MKSIFFTRGRSPSDDKGVGASDAGVVVLRAGRRRNSGRVGGVSRVTNLDELDLELVQTAAKRVGDRVGGKTE